MKNKREDEEEEEECRRRWRKKKDQQTKPKKRRGESRERRRRMRRGRRRFSNSVFIYPIWDKSFKTKVGRRYSLLCVEATAKEFSWAFC